MVRLVVIGGGAVGNVRSASRARRTAGEIDVVVCEAGRLRRVRYVRDPVLPRQGRISGRRSACLPAGRNSWRPTGGIDLVAAHPGVARIDAGAHQVAISSARLPTASWTTTRWLSRPGPSWCGSPILGLRGPRVFNGPVSWKRAVLLRRLLDSGTVHHAAAVGGGYTGLEAAEALVGAATLYGGRGRRGHAAPAGHGGRAHRRAGSGRAGTSHRTQAGNEAGRGARMSSRRPADRSGTSGAEDRHRPRGRRDTGVRPPPTCWSARVSDHLLGPPPWSWTRVCGRRCRLISLRGGRLCRAAAAPDS